MTEKDGVVRKVRVHFLRIQRAKCGGEGAVVGARIVSPGFQRGPTRGEAEVLSADDAGGQVRFPSPLSQRGAARLMRTGTRGAVIDFRLA
jgi:hypothetical protein